MPVILQATYYVFNQVFYYYTSLFEIKLLVLRFTLFPAVGNNKNCFYNFIILIKNNDFFLQ